jgi:hypothetical protein
LSGIARCGAVPVVVERSRVAALFEPHAQHDRRLAALVFHHVLVLDDAVGQRAQRGARAAFAVVERLVERGFDDLDPVALDQLEEAPLADDVAGDLRAQIAGARLGRARVRAQQSTVSSTTRSSRISSIGGVMTAPSANRSRASGGIEPGTAPPTSV